MATSTVCSLSRGGSAQGRCCRQLPHGGRHRSAQFRQDHALQSSHQAASKGRQFSRRYGGTPHRLRARWQRGKRLRSSDLPGVYSPTLKSEDEEEVAINDVLSGKMPGTPHPDAAVILVLNSTNLHSHLVLAARVIASGYADLFVLLEHGRTNFASRAAKWTCFRWHASWERQSHW